MISCMVAKTNLIVALETIEATPKGNARMAALKACIDRQPGLLRFFLDTVDPFITFGVQRMPTPTPSATDMRDADWAQRLFQLGSQLRNRELTGNAAQEAMYVHLSQCGVQQAKWSRRYLLRDLRVDIGARALQKVFGDDVVYIFKVPLAIDAKKVKPAAYAEGEWLLQPKLDGARCVAFIDAGGNVEFKSRTGKPWNNFESIRYDIKAALALHATPFVLDGEVVSLDDSGAIDFQALQKTMQRDDGVEVGNLRYVVFDSCTPEEWKQPRLPYGDRLKLAIGAVSDLQASGAQRVQVVPATAYVPGEDLHRVCQQYVDAGYEGGMLRRADVPVEMKKGRRLLKVKTFIDDEAVVVAVNPGKTKPTGAPTAILSCTFAANGKAFDMGSGISDAQARELLAHPPLGRKVTFKYFELTDAEVPRFPIFKCVRVSQDLPAEEDEE